MKKFLLKHWLILTVILVATLLRLYKLSTIPVSMFGDELDVGYHAYSVLKTGRDYSGNFLPLHFKSFAEWRTPLYLYAAVPTVAVFGITPLGVRLPAAIFGILGVWGLFLLVKKLTSNEKLAVISSLVLAFNPWHIQYSRAGFEVTMLLVFLLFGLYFFFESFEKPRLLWVSSSLLVLTPLIYSTAKLFTLFLMLFLFVFYQKDVFKLPRKYLLYALYALVIFGGITSYATLFSGGAQRFSYIGVFTDPVIEPEVGVLRLRDAQMRGESGVGLQPRFIDRVLHNKFTYVFENIANNYINALSFDFLFVNGDPNPRHMMDKMGMFFKVEVTSLILGLFYFFKSKNISSRVKKLTAFWILVGIIPASITRDGGNHATRLILILPPLVLLISYGVLKILSFGKYVFGAYVFAFVLLFGIYLHNYYVHYPWDSERWWHSGWSEAISEIKKIDADYDRVFITMSDEPAWIFFAGHYQYPPAKWHEGFPFKSTLLPGFGGLSFIDKYYFGSIDEDGNSIYDLQKYITSRDLYLASVKEIPWNLIQEPQKTPQGLKLLSAIAYPSGEPVFYIFTKNE